MKNRKAQRKVLGVSSNFGSDCMLVKAQHSITEKFSQKTLGSYRE